MVKEKPVVAFQGFLEAFDFNDVDARSDNHAAVVFI
jgi:hypothetical protein